MFDQLAEGDVLFLDLDVVLVRGPEGEVLRPEAKQILAQWKRLKLGILTNPARGERLEDVQFRLKEAGVFEYLAPRLVVLPSLIGCPMPDSRAFAVAAAMAGVPLASCAFASSNSSWRGSAVASGMAAYTPDGIEHVMGAEMLAAAGPVDEDTGPTYILKGRIVSMSDGGVVDNGKVVISKGKIAAILSDGQALPREFANVKVIETNGSIYPGLIDLHNHFVYNALPLWKVPRQYSNRSQWPRHTTYASDISLPIRCLARFTESSRALMRYIEVKALVGGVTTGQGILTKVRGSKRLFHGAMRNVEETNDPRLPEGRTRVPDLFVGDPERIEEFRRGLGSTKAYFYHLSEGTDAAARQRFTDLVDNDLIQPSLVGIHSLGLSDGDLEVMAAKGAKIVWSPLSNLLLYGKTLNLTKLKATGLRFSIGCDWSPSGGKNLLEELKVARFESRRQNAFTSRELVEAVTSMAAEVAGWHEHLGTIKPGAFADLIIIAGEGDGDPYDHLIDAREKDVQLVMVHGLPRYGDRILMQSLHPQPEHPLEELEVDGSEKALFLRSEGSDINDLSFRTARDSLANFMADLPEFLDRMNRQEAGLLSIGLDPQQEGISLVLDNEYEEPPDAAPAFDLLAPNRSVMADSIDLDPIQVREPSYAGRLDQATNLPDDLRQALKVAYDL